MSSCLPNPGPKWISISWFRWALVAWWRHWRTTSGIHDWFLIIHRSNLNQTFSTMHFFKKFVRIRSVLKFKIYGTIYFYMFQQFGIFGNKERSCYKEREFRERSRRVRFRFLFGLQITKDPSLNMSIQNEVCSLLGLQSQIRCLKYHAICHSAIRQSRVETHSKQML